MPVILKSSYVKQNFSRVIDQAISEDEIVVERYGKPYVVILSYRRYQQLLQVEQATAVSATSPRTNQPAAPQIGERVMGKVETIEAGDVYLRPEKENYQEWLLRVKRDQTEGIPYQPGQSRACIVLQLLPDDEIVECKPAPKRR